MRKHPVRYKASYLKSKAFLKARSSLKLLIWEQLYLMINCPTESVLKKKKKYTHMHVYLYTYVS